MPIAEGQVKKAIVTGLHRVLYQVNLKWTVIREEEISLMFQSVSNPTSWQSFFTEAAGTAIQQELVAHGSYCPGLERTLTTLEDESKTWSDLETHIIDNNKALSWAE